MVDVLGLGYFMPVFSFVFVFAISYALLDKTKILGENKFIHLLISFVIAVSFIVASSVRTYVETVTPWLAVLMIALFFIFILVSFSGRKIEDFTGNGFIGMIIIVLILIFFFAGVKVYSSVLLPLYVKVTNEERILGSVILFAVAIFASWVLTKK